MQALKLKPTDLWVFLGLPSEFIERWFLVAGVIGEYQAEMMEDPNG